MWSVLVFEKSHLGDLHRFERLKKFKSLSMDDKLNLCTDVGIAIKDMHNNDMISIEKLDNDLSDRRYNSRRYQT